MFRDWRRSGLRHQSGCQCNCIFSTLAATIDAWNAETSAVAKCTVPDGAVYTGLSQTGSLLYAADTVNGKMDVFNTLFQKTTVSGTFVDLNVAAGFTPYDIQNVGGKLYVEY